MPPLGEQRGVGEIASGRQLKQLLARVDNAAVEAAAPARPVERNAGHEQTAAEPLVVHDRHRPERPLARTAMDAGLAPAQRLRERLRAKRPALLPVEAGGVGTAVQPLPVRLDRDERKTRVAPIRLRQLFERRAIEHAGKQFGWRGGGADFHGSAS